VITASKYWAPRTSTFGVTTVEDIIIIVACAFSVGCLTNLAPAVRVSGGVRNRELFVVPCSVLWDIDFLAFHMLSHSQVKMPVADR